MNFWNNLYLFFINQYIFVFYNFRISDMTDLTEMFDECNDLECIDISKFNSFNSQLISKIIKRKLIKGIDK